MNSKPFPRLSIPDIAIDPVIARRLPHGLADYYAALPVGEDRGKLTVAMARPGDDKPIALLESLLGARIVPVQAAAHEIRTAINLVWQNENNSSAQILCCNATVPLAKRFADSLDANLMIVGEAEAQTVAQHGDFILTVTGSGDVDFMARWVRSVPGVLLFADETTRQVRHILLVLRGHVPDEQALRFVLPLAHACDASITLLGIDDEADSNLIGLLLSGGQTGQHLFECVGLIRQAGLAGSLKLREGDPGAQIALELRDGSYDLLVIAAETHGDAVSQILAALPTPQAMPILILKPALNGKEVNTR